MNSAALLLSLCVLIQAPQEPVDFLFEVRPILSEHCYACHGPDDRARKADLRLDRPAALRAPLASGDSLITPGKPDESELVRRLVTADESEVMPPPSSKNPLSPQQVDTLRRWIAEGARLPEQSHWAFNPISAPPLPTAATASRNPIDQFVESRLARVGLSPTGPARRETLLRRLSLDLTGLPPTPEEIQAFVNDPSPEAYAREVERLLASPRRGERLANDWLDLARYADTYGYQSDVDRDMSPYRDWVIRAFNQNLPYDQFIIWQIAGDLLPQPTREQYLATAFNRLHRQTNEGGSIEEEFRNEYVADRVHTFGTAFLGLTLECSRCHDHKYDPIRQADYYRLAAFFNNIDESGLYSHFTRATPTPTLLLYPDGAEDRHAGLLDQRDRLEARLAAVRKETLEKQQSQFPGSPVAVPVPEESDRFPFDEANPAANTREEQRPAQLVDGPEVVPGRMGQALRFNGDNSVQLKGVGAFRRTDPFSFSLWLKPGERQERAVVLHRSRAWTDSGSRGYELVLDQGRVSFALIHFYPGNALHVRSEVELPVGEWSHVVATYDGSSRAGGMALYLNGDRLAVEVIRDNLYRDIVHRGEWGDDTGGVELTLAGRFRDAGFRKGEIDELRVFSRELTGLEARRLFVPADNSEVTASAAEWAAHEASRAEPVRGAIQELTAVRQAENDLVTGIREIMVMKELPWRRKTWVLRRGVYDQRGDEVEPGTPEGIFPLPAGVPPNRLGLAEWLVSPRNPLTARVLVNRIWRLHFGRGIVPTQEDFGNQGQLPSHPELLDWLANWVINNGWDLQGLQRLIVTSAAYQRSSIAPAETLAADPENKWLARGPRHRLAAEQIRDSALAAAGLLSGRVGGASARPYQPAGLWEEAGTGKSYTPDKGEGLYRRSLYTFWRRTAPPPTMLTFDATSREVCTAKRESTATPLQSLVLLNDPQYVEAARVLAERVLAQKLPEGPARIEAIVVAVLGRQPTSREQQILGALGEEQRTWFREHPAEAIQLLSVGEQPRGETWPADELAALTVVAATCLNHDEFVMKR
jgi:hypothetical protein